MERSRGGTADCLARTARRFPWREAARGATPVSCHVASEPALHRTLAGFLFKTLPFCYYTTPSRAGGGGAAATDAYQHGSVHRTASALWLGTSSQIALISFSLLIVVSAELKLNQLAARAPHPHPHPAFLFRSHVDA